MLNKNIIDKIWDFNTIHQAPGHPAIININFIMLHEVTSAQSFEMLKKRNLTVLEPKYCLATIDHSIPTRSNRFEIFDNLAKKQVELLKDNAKKHDIPFFNFDSGYQGIVHVIGPELGITQPGMTIICGDSHTSTHGAFGALAFGVGSTELTQALATGCLLLKKPKTMKIELKGKLQKGIFAKDIIMKIIATIGTNGGTGYAIEYTGNIIKQLSMESRMTLCNMSIECGSRAGLISPDEITFEYLKGKPYSPSARSWAEAVKHWSSFQSDINCNYDKEIIIDVDNLEPMVTWGINPAQAISINQRIPNLSDIVPEHQDAAKKAFDYIQLPQGAPISQVPIDWAFIGSCTNSRIEDLRIAAHILKNNKVHPSVTLYIVPGSENVLKQARREGLEEIFIKSGAHFRMPGCSLCVAMNDDKVPPGKRCISTSNRNFIGRQGPDSYTHLASPATVAASAITGKITSPKPFL